MDDFEREADGSERHGSTDENSPVTAEAKGTDLDRRQLLKTIGGATAITGLAGCPGDESDVDPGDTDTVAGATETVTDDGEGDTATETDAETDTETDTETETATATEEPGASVGACAFESAELGSDCADPIELGSNVTEDTTLGGECNRYVVSSQLNVQNGATLTIEPGTEIRFQEATQFRIKPESAIMAEGTCEDPILITGTEEERGWWDGIYVNSERSDNVMDQVIVEYGGGGDLNANIDMGTEWSDSARLTLRNCTLRESETFGLRMGSDSEVEDTENNRYTANGQGAVRARTDNIHTIDGTSSFLGNDDDHVYVEAVTLGHADVTWDKIDVPYRMEGEATHQINNVELEIEAGNTLEFEEFSQLRFQPESTITIQGRNPDAEQETDIVDPIIFTGTQEERGWWDGIYVNTENQHNVMEHVVVEWGGGGDLNANLDMGTEWSDSARLTLQHCTFRESETYGLRMGSSTEIEETQSNQYTANGQGAVLARTDNIHTIDGTSSFTGNDDDHVYVEAVTLSADDVTWDLIDVPYRMEGEATHKVSDVELEIEAGNTLEFEEFSQFRFQPESTITMVGTESDVITLTGTQEERGWWDGIYLNTENVDNQMEQVVVEYGGGGDLNANLDMGTEWSDSAWLAISNCTLRESGTYGLRMGSSTEIDAESNLYTANTDGAVRVRTDNVHTLSGNSDFTGNDDDHVYVEAVTLSAQGVTWDNINAPYRLANDNHQIDGVELEIEAGATIEAEQQAKLTFESDSTCTMNGTADEEITFTVPEGGEIAGWWDGIYFASEDLRNTMTNVVVEYGGRDIPGNVTMATEWGDDAALTLENSTLRDSANYGFRANDDVMINNDVCDVNTFENNAGGDCLIE